MERNRRSPDRRTFLRILGAGTAGVGLAGCTDSAQSGGGGNNRSTGGSGSGSKGNTVKLGSLAPLSGIFSSSGKYVNQGNKLAAKQINKQGGISGKNVEVVVGDTETDPKAGASTAKQLINQKGVNMLSGAVSSSVGLAVTPIADKNQVPYNAGIASLEYGSGTCSPYVYSNNPSTKMTANAYLPYFANKKGMNKVFFITADYEWGQNAWDYYKKLAPKLGVEVAGNAFAALGAKDYSSQITKAINSGADTLILTLYGKDITKCINQLIQFNAREEFKNITTVVNSIELNRAMNDLEGFYFGGKYYWEIDHPRNKKFVKRFRNEYGEVPPMPAALQYGSTYQMLRAAQKANSTSGKAIAKQMEGWTADPFYKGGTMTFRPCDHRMLSDVFIMKGKAKSERDSENDLLDVLQRFNGEKIAADCVGCSLPAWS